MQFKIRYIHGLSGGVKSRTNTGLCEVFGAANVDCLSYPSETATFGENFALILRKFEDAQRQNPAPITAIVGTSLGGFFASKLADELVKNRGVNPDCLALVLINPATNPFETGKKLGYENSPVFRSYKGQTAARNFAELGIAHTVFVALDDELLDPQQTLQYFAADNVVKLPFGGHSCWNAQFEIIAEKIRELAS